MDAVGAYNNIEMAEIFAARPLPRNPTDPGKWVERRPSSNESHERWAYEKLGEKCKFDDNLQSLQICKLRHLVDIMNGKAGNMEKQNKRIARLNEIKVAIMDKM